MLKHIDSQALETIVTELYEEILELVRGDQHHSARSTECDPLLVGRKESIASVVELVNKLDQPLDTASQLKVYKLLHTSSVDAETLIRDFFVEQPGGGDTNQRCRFGDTSPHHSDYRTKLLDRSSEPARSIGSQTIDR